MFPRRAVLKFDSVLLFFLFENPSPGHPPFRFILFPNCHSGFPDPSFCLFLALAASLSTFFFSIAIPKSFLLFFLYSLPFYKPLLYGSRLYRSIDFTLKAEVPFSLSLLFEKYPFLSSPPSFHFFTEQIKSPDSSGFVSPGSGWSQILFLLLIPFFHNPSFWEGSFEQPPPPPSFVFWMTSSLIFFFSNPSKLFSSASAIFSLFLGGLGGLCSHPQRDFGLPPQIAPSRLPRSFEISGLATLLFLLPPQTVTPLAYDLPPSAMLSWSSLANNSIDQPLIHPT